MAPNFLLGIGNEDNGDDGAGMLVAGQFRMEGWTSLSCGTAPENFTGLIRKARPDLLVLVDAAAMGISPGEFRIIPRNRIADVGIGTHQIPLSMLIDFLSDAAGRIVLIGIQPGRVAPGEGITEPVRKGAARLADEIGAGRIDRIPVLD
jgi:hydrogenase 3 maturation protease